MKQSEGCDFHVASLAMQVERLMAELHFGRTVVIANGTRRLASLPLGRVTPCVYDEFAAAVEARHTVFLTSIHGGRLQLVIQSDIAVPLRAAGFGVADRLADGLAAAAWRRRINCPWMLVVLLLAALALHGVDGQPARGYKRVSALAARLDLEVEALPIFSLSAAAFLLERTGAWILPIGLRRHAVVLANCPVPRLGCELHLSFRRKFISVVRVPILWVYLVPFVSAPLSAWSGAIATLLLYNSGTIDGLYLLGISEEANG